MILSYLSGPGSFCYDENGAVTIFTHKDDIWTVDDDFLTIGAFADENLVWLFGMDRRMLDSQLDAVARIDHSIEIVHVFGRLAKPVDNAFFIGTFSFETDVDFVFGVVFVSPSIVNRIELCRALAIPSITVSTLTTYLLQMSAGHTITVADIGFAEF